MPRRPGRKPAITTLESQRGEQDTGPAAVVKGSAASSGPSRAARGALSPIRRQYLEIKARYPDAILFFRLGDFYETFDDDAELCSRELGIALTSKPMGKGLRVPLAGVPLQSVEQHLARLIERGHRVAICDQLEDARAAKGLVARGVVRVVSPGTALEPSLLEAGASSYCAALWLPPPDKWELGTKLATGRRQPLRAGIAAVDLSTGAFRVCELAGEGMPELRAAVEEELARLGVRELLLPEDAPYTAGESEDGKGPTRTPRPAACFEPEQARRLLQRRFALDDVEGLGLGGRPAALRAAGALLEYLERSQPEGERTGGLRHLARPRLYEPSAAMQLDPATQRALSLFEAGRGGGGAGSLLELLDRCQTAAGKRLLRERLSRPLLQLDAIEERLERVALLASETLVRARLGEALEAVPDLERLLGRVSAGLAKPAEVARLGAGLRAAAGLRDLLPAQEGSGLAQRMRSELRPCSEAQEAIGALLNDEPAADFDEGGVVRPGVDADLDRLRAQLRSARAAIAALEERERAATGIANLKVGYHRTFGYYLEVSKGQMAKAPAEWERRQTLAGGQRYVTPELRDHERQVLEAREGLGGRERELFQRLCRQIAQEAESVRALAAGVARLDLAWAAAESAAQWGWTRPRLDRSDALELRASRHPMVEAALPAGEFVPNDLTLRGEAEQILLITGPNMAGKSTYLRQTALIVLLAQSGFYVPAAEARIGLVDRIFARVGAQDDLAAGQSTFMVEMLETAAILAAAGDRSLLVLDEIGRGTSTYDGLAIAQALLEHLVRGPLRGPRTLFATHFHELTALAGSHDRIVNHTVAVAETSRGIEFLYRIVPGGADRSYGIHVAEMAGLPAALLERARRILAELEQGARAAALELPALELLQPEAAGRGVDPAPAGDAQGQLFELEPSALARELATLDIDNLTPLEAIGGLYALRAKARRELEELEPGGPRAGEGSP